MVHKVAGGKGCGSHSGRDMLGGDIRGRDRGIYTLTCTNRPVCFSISNILA